MKDVIVCRMKKGSDAPKLGKKARFFRKVSFSKQMRMMQLKGPRIVNKVW